MLLKLVIIPKQIFVNLIRREHLIVKKENSKEREVTSTFNNGNSPFLLTWQTFINVKYALP